MSSGTVWSDDQFAVLNDANFGDLSFCCARVRLNGLHIHHNDNIELVLLFCSYCQHFHGDTRMAIGEFSVSLLLLTVLRQDCSQVADVFIMVAIFYFGKWKDATQITFRL